MNLQLLCLIVLAVVTPHFRYIGVEFDGWFLAGDA